MKVSRETILDSSLFHEIVCQKSPKSQAKNWGELIRHLGGFRSAIEYNKTYSRDQPIVGWPRFRVQQRECLWSRRFCSKGVVATLAIVSIGAAAEYVGTADSFFTGPSSQQIGSSPNPGEPRAVPLASAWNTAKRFWMRERYARVDQAAKDAGQEVPRGMVVPGNVYVTPDGRRPSRQQGRRRRRTRR